MVEGEDSTTGLAIKQRQKGSYLCTALGLLRVSNQTEK